MEPDQYAYRRKILIDYLSMKVGAEDWHGVADAANDLRELDAEHRGFSNAPGPIGLTQAPNAFAGASLSEWGKDLVKNFESTIAEMSKKRRKRRK